MNELTAMVLRLAFFVLLWVFVFSIAGVLRTDMFGAHGRSRRQRRRAAREAQRSQAQRNQAQQPAPAAAGAYSGGYEKSAEARPHELVVTSGSRAGTVVALGSAPVTIGRSPDNTLVIDDDFASSHHARIFPEGGAWYVEDVGSTNGTFAGDQPITSPVRLPVGTPVTVGHSTVELRS